MKVWDMEPDETDSGGAGAAPVGKAAEEETAAFPAPELDVVLVAHAEVATCRLVSEALLGFCRCEVDTATNAHLAFERAMQRDYALLLLDFHLPVLRGEDLYEFITRVYRYRVLEKRVPPPVIFLGETADSQRQDALKRDVRVKGVVLKPFKISRILEGAHQVLPEKAPGEV